VLVSSGHSLVVVMFDFYFTAGNAGCISVASYGHSGTGARVPSTSIYFLVTSEPHNWTLRGCSPGQKIYRPVVLSLFIARMDVSIKLFSLSLVPLLARNPGDATGRMHQHGLIGLPGVH